MRCLIHASAFYHTSAFPEQNARNLSVAGICRRTRRHVLFAHSAPRPERPLSYLSPYLHMPLRAGENQRFSRLSVRNHLRNSGATGLRLAAWSVFIHEYSSTISCNVFFSLRSPTSSFWFAIIFIAAQRLLPTSIRLPIILILFVSYTTVCKRFLFPCSLRRLERPLRHLSSSVVVRVGLIVLVHAISFLAIPRCLCIAA